MTTQDVRVRRRRVLLVDDHRDSAEMLGLLLARRGFDVTIAHTVETALTAARETRVDVVVSDIGLPDGTGHDLLRMLRRASPLPAVALSGLDRGVGPRAQDDAGFDEYFRKPVTVDSLAATLRRLCG